jgi:thiamine biosynthesis protein ThiS
LTCLNRSRYAQPRALSAPRTDLTITLNGEPYELQEALTLAALLERLEIDPRRVAVEHNLTVVKRARYEDIVVTDGDRVEIVNFVGGGSADDRQH